MLEESRAIGPWSGGHDHSSFGSCSSSMAPHTDEAMSASSRMAQEVDEAMSESSWNALAKGKERDWWSIDLEGEVVDAHHKERVLKQESPKKEGESNGNQKKHKTTFVGCWKSVGKKQRN